jgi:hypothetical protein
VAAAYVQPPEGWGPKQILLVALEKLGYTVAELRFPGTGEVRLLIR